MNINETIRHTLLLQLEAAYPVSLPQETLRQGIHLAGFNMPPTDLKKELQYLVDKGFVTPIKNELCPACPRYKLSTKGIDFLDINLWNGL